MNDRARLTFSLERLIGLIAAVALLSCAAFQVAVVILRSAFDAGFVWLHDLVLAAFAVAVVFGLALAFFRDRHVRVDVATSGLSDRTKWRRDFAGFIALALPLAGLILWTGGPFAARSWVIMEGARDVGGLPGVFLVKTLVPLLGLLLVVGGAALLRRRVMER